MRPTTSSTVAGSRENRPPVSAKGSESTASQASSTDCHRSPGGQRAEDLLARHAATSSGRSQASVGGQNQPPRGRASPCALMRPWAGELGERGRDPGPRVDHRRHLGGELAAWPTTSRSTAPAAARAAVSATASWASTRAARRALLAGEAEGRRDDARHGLVEVRVRVDDHAVLPAHLRHHVLDVGLALRGVGRTANDLEPHRAEPVKAIACTRGSRTSAAPASPSPGTSRSAPAGAAPPAAPRPAPRASRRLLGRLEHHGVAGGQRRGRHAAGDREREVPRRDHRRHAARLVGHRVALAGHLHQLGALLELDRLACVVLEEVDRLAHVGVGLGPGLCALAHLQARPARGGGRAGSRRRRSAPRRAGRRSARPTRDAARRRRPPPPPLRLAAAGGLRHHAIGRAGIGRHQPLGPVPARSGAAPRQRGVQPAQRGHQRLAHRRRRSSSTGSLANGFTERAAARRGPPRPRSPRNDSFAVFSSSRRTR